MCSYVLMQDQKKTSLWLVRFNFWRKRSTDTNMNDEKVDVKRRIYRSFFRAINTKSKKRFDFHPSQYFCVWFLKTLSQIYLFPCFRNEFPSELKSYPWIRSQPEKRQMTSLSNKDVSIQNWRRVGLRDLGKFFFKLSNESKQQPLLVAFHQVKKVKSISWK